MKKYLLKVDGYTVGVVEFTPDEVKELNKDSGIQVTEYKGEGARE